jgi:hypothetical protein
VVAVLRENQALWLYRNASCDFLLNRLVSFDKPPHALYEYSPHVGFSVHQLAESAASCEVWLAAMTSTIQQ